MCFYFEGPEENNMDEEMIENGDIVSLVNDDGETVNFYHVATIDYKNKWYVFLQPAEEMEDIEEDEVVIFGLEADENGEDVLTPVDDEKLLDEVYEEYFKNFPEDDECDCDECKGCGCGCDGDHN